jgi:hypothetical protein
MNGKITVSLVDGQDKVEVQYTTNKFGLLIHATDKPVVINKFKIENQLRALFGVNAQFTYDSNFDGSLQVNVIEFRKSETDFWNGQKSR